MGGARGAKKSRPHAWASRRLRPAVFRVAKHLYTNRRLTPAYDVLDRVLAVPAVNRVARVMWERYVAIRPQRIAVHITERCNLACAYCYVDHSRASLSITDWLEVVDRGIDELGAYFVQVLGGEPLLHPRFFWFIEQLVSRRLIVAINTNGTLLDDRTVERLLRLDPMIMFYFNFDCREAYQTLAGPGADYNLVFANLLRTRRAGFFTAVFLTVTRLNYPHVESFLDMLDAHDIRYVIERCLPVGSDSHHIEVSPAEWSALMERLSRSGRIPSPNRVFARMTGSTCQDYGRILYISSTGEVLPCAFAPDSLSVGNVTRETMTVLWNRVLSRREAWHRLPDDCRGCEHENVCGGGCKTHAFLATGRLDARDPLCHNRAVPPTVLGL